MVRMPEYSLVGADGPVRLVDIFDGRSQLIVYNHMWDWAPSGSAAAAPVSPRRSTRLGFLDNYDARFVIVTQGPIEAALAYAERVGNKMTWYSTADSPFGADVDAPPGGGFALNVFLRSGETVYRTWHTTGRGNRNTHRHVRLGRCVALRSAGGVEGLAGRLAAEANLQRLARLAGRCPVVRFRSELVCSAHNAERDRVHDVPTRHFGGRPGHPADGVRICRHGVSCRGPHGTLPQGDVVAAVSSANSSIDGRTQRDRQPECEGEGRLMQSTLDRDDRSPGTRRRFDSVPLASDLRLSVVPERYW